MIPTAGVPLGAFGLPFAAQTPLDVGERIAVGRQHFAQQRDVRDGQSQRVDLAEPLLVRERGHVTSELIERRVDAAKHQRFITRFENRRVTSYNTTADHVNYCIILH